MKKNPSYKYRNEKKSQLCCIIWDLLVFWMICKLIAVKESLYNVERNWKYCKCLEAALCEISSLEQINEAWLDGGKINLHSLIRCNPLGAILTPLKLQKVRALTHACLNVLHVHILNAESPSTGAAYEAPDALICWSNIVSFLLLPTLMVPVSC